MAAHTQDEILEVLTTMKEDRQEVVLNAALELWEDDGCPLQAAGAGQDVNASHVNTSLDCRLSLEIKVD